MIKKYTQFVNEEMEPTIPSVKEGEVDKDPMTCIKITKDEENLFNTEPVLQDLVDQRKITYQSGEMCYPIDDKEVIDIIKIYFNSVGVNESKRMNEVRHNDFDEDPDSVDPEIAYSSGKSSSEYSQNRSYHIRRDTQLAKDAFQAGVDYTSACESPNSEECDNAQDFDTWWSNYKK